MKKIKMDTKKVEIRCIYCKKTSKESGRAMFMVYAPGQYYQCYPELCDENKEKYLPWGDKLEKGPQNEQ